jgi:multiple sugar transport system substrate-binding protein
LQELQEIACYFNGKDPLGAGKPMFGVMQPGGPNSQLFDWWKDIAGSWVASPDGAQPGVNRTFHFNPDTMEPLINSPGHVAALQWMVDTYKCGPKDFASIDLGAHFNRFVQGEAVFAWSAGDIAALAQEKESKVKGQIGLIPIPGSTQVYDAKAGKMMTVEKAVPNYNVYGASWSGEISKYSDNPEATYALMAFLASQPMRNWNVKWGFDGIDIGRRTDFLPPDGTSDIEVWKSGGFDEGDAKRVSHGIYENLTGPTVEYLKIPGSAEYNLALELAVAQALTGQATPQQALDSVAKQWGEITERLGLDSQKAAYRETIGLAN